MLEKIGLKKEGGGVHRHPPIWKITMRQTAAIWMLSLWFHKKSSWNLSHDNMRYRVCLTPTLKWRLWIIHFSNQEVQNSIHLSRFIDSWNKVCKRFICKLNLSSASLRTSSSSSSSSTSWSSSERQNHTTRISTHVKRFSKMKTFYNPPIHFYAIFELTLCQMARNHKTVITRQPLFASTFVLRLFLTIGNKASGEKPAIEFGISTLLLCMEGKKSFLRVQW